MRQVNVSGMWTPEDPKKQMRETGEGARKPLLDYQINFSTNEELWANGAALWKGPSFSTGLRQQYLNQRESFNLSWQFLNPIAFRSPQPTSDLVPDPVLHDSSLSVISLPSSSPSPLLSFFLSPSLIYSPPFSLSILPAVHPSLALWFWASGWFLAICLVVEQSSCSVLYSEYGLPQIANWILI